MRRLDTVQFVKQFPQRLSFHISRSASEFKFLY